MAVMTVEVSEWERMEERIKDLKAQLKRRTICADCGAPQPDEGSLHFEDCPAHKKAFCIVCRKEAK